MSLSWTLAFTYEEKAGAGMEPAGAERHRRSPEGKRAGASESIEPARGMKTPFSTKPELYLEAGAGIEPANSGFADRDLTTWLPRQPARADNIVVAALVSSAEHRYIGAWHKRLYK